MECMYTFWTYFGGCLRKKCGGDWRPWILRLSFFNPTLTPPPPRPRCFSLVLKKKSWRKSEGWGWLRKLISGIIYKVNFKVSSPGILSKIEKNCKCKVEKHFRIGKNAFVMSRKLFSETKIGIKIWFYSQEQEIYLNVLTSFREIDSGNVSFR